MKALPLIVLLLCSLLGCGKAAFSGRSSPEPPASIPVVITNTDVYVEIGQEFSGEIAGGVEITNLEMFATTQWPGASPLEFEMRTALSGNAGVDQIVILGSTIPDQWATAATVFNQSVTGGNAQSVLKSANLNSLLAPIVAQKKFWVLVRVKYSGLGLPRVFTLSNVQAYAEGEKSLSALAPLLNLTY